MSVVCVCVYVCMCVCVCVCVCVCMSVSESVCCVITTPSLVCYICRPSHLSAGWGGSSTLYNIPTMLCLCTPFSCIIFHMYSTVNVCCTYMHTDSSPFYACTLNTQHTCTPNAHHTHTHTNAACPHTCAQFQDAGS